MNPAVLAAHWVRGRETLPRYLILGMTNLCNSKCVTCFYWDHLNVNRHLEMRLDEYDRALSDLGSLYSVVEQLDRAGLIPTGLPSILPLALIP